MAPQPKSDSREELRTHALAARLAEFSARAGHDLLGPINQASSLLALFIHRQKNRPGGDADATEAETLLGFLQSSAARMQGVLGGVKPFLSVAAAEPGLEPVDLNNALNAATLKLENTIRQSGAEIVREGELPAVSAKGAQMATLFEILIDNAIKFRAPDEPPRLRISAKRAGDDWEVAVVDNGLGIDAEYREAVFLPFRRLFGKEYPGAGMGLSTAKLIVQLLGGAIRIHPAADFGGTRGTAVVFSIPG